MFEDWNRQVLIAPSSQAVTEFMMRKVRSEAYKVLLPEEMQASVQPLRDAAAILQAYPAAGSADLAKALELGNRTVNEFEAKSLTLPTADTHSLYWAWMLGLAWTERGWAALDSGDLPTADSYLRAAWHLDLDQLAGYQLGRLLEAKKDKAAAAHQYELALIASDDADKLLTFHDYDIQAHIRDSYQKLTGKPLTSTGLNHGQYNGSLRAELDKETEFHSFIPTSTITGEALFTVAYEEGKPVKARFLSGDKKVASMAAALEKHRLGSLLPANSKARLLREVRLVCSQYGGGCDAYLLLPTEIKIPAKSVVTTMAPSAAPKEIKTIHIGVQP
jgi:hypothetical protein